MRERRNLCLCHLRDAFTFTSLNDPPLIAHTKMADSLLLNVTRVASQHALYFFFRKADLDKLSLFACVYRVL